MKRSIVTSLVVVMMSCVMCSAQQRRPGDFRQDVELKVGDPAPDFDLKKLHGMGNVKLSTFKGKRPVVLIFGSYT